MDAFLFTLTLSSALSFLLGGMGELQDGEDRLIPPASFTFLLSVPTQRPVPNPTIVPDRASGSSHSYIRHPPTRIPPAVIYGQALHTLPYGFHFLISSLGFPRNFLSIHPILPNPSRFERPDYVRVMLCFTVMIYVRMFPPFRSSCVCPPVHHPFRL